MGMENLNTDNFLIQKLTNIPPIYVGKLPLGNKGSRVWPFGVLCPSQISYIYVEMMSLRMVEKTGRDKRIYKLRNSLKIRSARSGISA